MSKYWNANAFLNLPYTIILKFFLIKKIDISINN